MSETTVVLSDIQIPFQDKRALALSLDFIRDIKPRQVILNGDIIDAYGVSTFSKDPLTPATLEVEREQAGRLMGGLAQVPVKLWIGGNHEDRLRRYVWDKAPAFASLGDADFPELFRLADHGFAWEPYGYVHRLGKLLVTHGSIVRSHSGVSARAHYDKYGQSVLIGHTHRLGAYYHTNMAGVHGAWENGCLCRLDPEYEHHPNWQQGFSVVHVHPGGRFQVEQVPIFRGKLVYGGRMYGGPK